MLLWIIAEGIWKSRFTWMSRLGPAKVIVQADQPGLYWFAICFHLAFFVFLVGGAYLLWREAGPARPPAPRPKRPPQDYPQYRKKKSP